MQIRTCMQCGKEFQVESGKSRRSYCTLCAGRRMVEGKKIKREK